MTVIPIAVDQLVLVFVVYGGDAYSDGLLAAVEVAKASNALPGLGVFLVGPLFEAADEHHHAESVAFDLARGFGGYGGVAGGALIDGVGDGHFTNSAKAG
jgi:hypothetical protein